MCTSSSSRSGHDVSEGKCACALAVKALFTHGAVSRGWMDHEEDDADDDYMSDTEMRCVHRPNSA